MKPDTSEVVLRAGVALEFLTSRVVRDEATFRRFLEDCRTAVVNYNALDVATSVELPPIPDHWDWNKLNQARAGILKKKWIEAWESALRDERLRRDGDRNALPVFRVAMRAVRIAKLSPTKFKSRIESNVTELEEALADLEVEPAISRQLIDAAKEMHLKGGRRAVSFEEVAVVAEEFLRAFVSQFEASANRASGLGNPDI